MDNKPLIPPTRIPNPGEIVYPKCPYCAEQPVRVLCAPFEMGAFMCLSIYCGNPECSKMLSVVPIWPAEAPMIDTSGRLPIRRTN